MNGLDSDQSREQTPGGARAYAIDVNDGQQRSRLDGERLRDVAADVLRHEGVRSAEISIALIDGETMQRLNREHLGHDFDTDVLSFLLECDDDASGTVSDGSDLPRGTGKSIDGEILISTDVAAEAASRFGGTAEDEVTLYLVHGLLHLAGYDDLTPDEKALMRQRERFHLSRWNLDPVFHDADGDKTEGQTTDGDGPVGSARQVDDRTGGTGR